MEAAHKESGNLFQFTGRSATNDIQKVSSSCSLNNCREYEDIVKTTEILA